MKYGQPRRLLYKDLDEAEHLRQLDDDLDSQDRHIGYMRDEMGGLRRDQKWILRTMIALLVTIMGAIAIEFLRSL